MFECPAGTSIKEQADPLYAVGLKQCPAKMLTR